MLSYDYYRKNNTAQFDYKELSDLNTNGICDHKAKEAILLKCIHCANTYREAYKCKDDTCPLFLLKTKWMKRPHKCSEAFLKIRKDGTNKYIKEENNDEL